MEYVAANKIMKSEWGQMGQEAFAFGINQLKFDGYYMYDHN
jgi:hypothetical protein